MQLSRNQLLRNETEGEKTQNKKKDSKTPQTSSGNQVSTAYVTLPAAETQHQYKKKRVKNIFITSYTIKA